MSGWIPKGGGIDTSAIHDDEADEISALTLVTAANGDHVLIEDASDSNNKKRVAASDFLAGSSSHTWTTWSVTWTATSSNPAIGNGTLVGRYMQIDDLVIATIEIEAGSTTTFGSGTWEIDLPVTARDANAVVGHGIVQEAGVGQHPVLAINSPGAVDADHVRFITHSTSAGGAWNGVTASQPFTWGNNDALYAQITYEAA